MQSKASEEVKTVNIIDLITELSTGTRFDTLNGVVEEKTKPEGSYRNRNENVKVPGPVVLHFVRHSHDVPGVRSGGGQPGLVSETIELPAGTDITIYRKIHRGGSGEPLPYAGSERIAAVFLPELQIAFRTDLTCEVRRH
ncbi:hypothetical protein LRY29_01700 [Candidatus Saccharibacteria bacterium]|nr:hypothetical protein [Candidatus Saccharibacteria bacterium]